MAGDEARVEETDHLEQHSRLGQFEICPFSQRTLYRTAGQST